MHLAPLPPDPGTVLRGGPFRAGANAGGSGAPAKRCVVTLNPATVAPNYAQVRAELPPDVALLMKSRPDDMPTFWTTDASRPCWIIRAAPTRRPVRAAGSGPPRTCRAGSGFCVPAGLTRRPVRDTSAGPSPHYRRMDARAAPPGQGMQPAGTDRTILRFAVQTYLRGN